MNIQSLMNYLTPSFQQNSQSFLSVKSQKTAIIVSIALVCLAALSVVYRCFKSSFDTDIVIGKVEYKDSKKETSNQSISKQDHPIIEQNLEVIHSATLSSKYFDVKLPFETETIDEIIYKGEFKDGQLHGMGRVICCNRIIEGQFENGLLNGCGQIIFNNGKILEGTFKDEQLIQGKIVYPGIKTEEGIFCKDLLNDEKGKITYADGRIEEGRFVMGNRVKLLQDWTEWMDID